MMDGLLLRNHDRHGCADILFRMDLDIRFFAIINPDPLIDVLEPHPLIDRIVFEDFSNSSTFSGVMP
jgi:hypothetical protein